MGNYYYSIPEIENLKAKRDVEGLIKALKGETFTDAAQALDKLREEAAQALGELRDKRAVEPLIEALGHKYPGDRMYAANALGEIGDKRAIEPLARAYHDNNQYVRYYVVIALSRFKDDERALKALEEVLRDPDPGFRRIAAIALGKIK